MKRQIETSSPEETKKAAADMAAGLAGGEVIAIDGDLGAGKTVFVKGLAEGLGITANVTSPTFNIVKKYSGRLELNHFDVYRIEEPSELYEIGFGEYLESGAVTVIEWAGLVAEELPEDAIHITVEKTGDDTRRITIEDGR